MASWRQCIWKHSGEKSSSRQKTFNTEFYLQLICFSNEDEITTFLIMQKLEDFNYSRLTVQKMLKKHFRQKIKWTETRIYSKEWRVLEIVNYFHGHKRLEQFLASYLDKIKSSQSNCSQLFFIFFNVIL